MRNVFVIGDIHGDWHPIRDFYNRHKNENLFTADDVVIFLGDFGAQFFFNMRDWKFKHNLTKFPFTFFVVRGNHEERPSICAQKKKLMWHTETFFGNDVFVENEFPQIKYAQDIPAIYNIDGLKTLVMGGAYSVDKWYRLASGWNWFENEQMTKEEMDIARELIKEPCDIVLSHTCPQIFEPFDKFSPMVDQSLVDKSMEIFFNEVQNKLQYKIWMWGHYHEFREYEKIDNEKQLMLFNDVIVEIHNSLEDEIILY